MSDWNQNTGSVSISCRFPPWPVEGTVLLEFVCHKRRSVTTKKKWSWNYQIHADYLSFCIFTFSLFTVWQGWRLLHVKGGNVLFRWHLSHWTPALRFIKTLVYYIWGLYIYIFIHPETPCAMKCKADKMIVRVPKSASYSHLSHSRLFLGRVQKLSRRRWHGGYLVEQEEK